MRMLAVYGLPGGLMLGGFLTEEFGRHHLVVVWRYRLGTFSVGHDSVESAAEHDS